MKPDQRVKQANTYDTDSYINSKVEKENQNGYRLEDIKKPEGSHKIFLIFEKEEEEEE